MIDMYRVPIQREEPIFHPSGVLFGYSKHLFSVDDTKFLKELTSMNELKDEFQINIDVQHFLPEEVTVKISDDRYICIECIQEKRDKQGYNSINFLKKIYLTEQYDINKVLAKLSINGLLTITAPKFEKQESKVAERKIDISQTGQPARDSSHGSLKHKL